MKHIIGAIFLLPVFVCVLALSAALALFEEEVFGFSWDMASAVCFGSEHERTR